jgi:hypothetical protein
MDTQQDILTQEIFVVQPRRMLLPLWVKIFIWIFIVLGAITPIGYILGSMGANFHFSIFGLDSNEPFSIQGMILFCLFVYNGIVAYMLWTEKKLAVAMALVAAYLNGLVCVGTMAMALTNGNINLRLELIPIFFFIKKLRSIRDIWQTGVSSDQAN